MQNFPHLFGFNRYYGYSVKEVKIAHEINPTNEIMYMKMATPTAPMATPAMQKPLSLYLFGALLNSIRAMSETINPAVEIMPRSKKNKTKLEQERINPTKPKVWSFFVCFSHSADALSQEGLEKNVSLFGEGASVSLGVS